MCVEGGGCASSVVDEEVYLTCRRRSLEQGHGDYHLAAGTVSASASCCLSDVSYKVRVLGFGTWEFWGLGFRVFGVLGLGFWV